MATNTPNYGLKKPAQNDFYNVDDFNANMDIIDAKIKEVQAGAGDMSVSVYDPQGKHTDAFSRTNHTGTQPASTISDFAAAVRSVVLTGLSTATNAAVEAADTVIAAFGKLQAQINAKLNLSGGTMTGPITLPGDPTAALHAATKGYVDKKSGTLTELARFTTSGTFNPADYPSIGNMYLVLLVGGGGAGGYGYNGSVDSSGAGGGAGQTVFAVLHITTNTPYIIGSGGTPHYSNVAVLAGGQTSISGINAAGGFGGVDGSTVVDSQSYTNGMVKLYWYPYGADGGHSSCPDSDNLPSNGANSSMGVGGLAGTTSVPGGAGGTGAGGGGGNCDCSSKAGGAGGSGIIIIYGWQ